MTFSGIGGVTFSAVGGVTFSEVARVKVSPVSVSAGASAGNSVGICVSSANKSSIAEMPIEISIDAGSLNATTSGAVSVKALVSSLPKPNDGLLKPRSEASKESLPPPKSKSCRLRRGTATDSAAPKARTAKAERIVYTGAEEERM